MPTNNDDLRATIARLRKLHESGRAWATDRGGDWQDVSRLERDIWKTLPMILDAAEDSLTMFSVAEMAQLQTDARNAALEEAAKLADDWDERDGVWGVGTAIRALKEPTHDQG